MNKENMIDVSDDLVPNENQNHLDLPKSMMESCVTDVEPQIEHQSMIRDLILMALPSPSMRVH